MALIARVTLLNFICKRQFHLRLQHTPLPTRFWTKLQLPLNKPEHAKLNALPPQTNPFFWKLKPRITSLTHQKLTPGDRARLGFLEKIFQKIAKKMQFF
jgi:hypothetical protein